MRIEQILPIVAAMPIVAALSLAPHARADGSLSRDGRRLFPIGCYELPQDDGELKAMAAAGINLVRCHRPGDLDRVKAAGMMGWISLPLQQGATDALREAVEAVKDHPALAVWEGPDEIVWSFTAASGLEEKAGIRRNDWWEQVPKAVEYAEEQARRIMPELREAIRLVRSLDDNHHQIWFNEARESDAKYVRQYLDYIDVTGCDDYPVRPANRSIVKVGLSTDRWKRIGRGKPVWMVLQAFSWSSVHREGGSSVLAYPSLAESRFMAYDAIAHGVRGILYWGSRYAAPAGFRDSIYALTSELAALQPFLTAPEERAPAVALIEADDEQASKGVRMTVRRSGKEWLLILVNEDDRRHMGVEVSGLHQLNGARLDLLYGAETAMVEHGEFVTRMQPHEVKVFATGREWETPRRGGRDFRQ
jgi:hypothetical protein